MFRLVLVFILVVATTGYGRHIIPRIVGDKNITIEDYPYQISLQLPNGHWCGGSLIRPNVVLTAAHCMNYPLIFYSVRAGSTITEEGGQVVQVSDICNHPKYDEFTLDYDVSVLKLKKAFQLNSDVQLINLQNVSQKVPEKTMAVVTGWGALDGQGRHTKILQKVEVPKIDQKICEEMYISFTDRMTCYGYPEGGEGSCQEDTGGPLVANGKQVGIVSFTYGCYWPNYPGIYASLENKEIHDHINNCLAKFS